MIQKQELSSPVGQAIIVVLALTASAVGWVVSQIDTEYCDVYLVEYDCSPDAPAVLLSILSAVIVLFSILARRSVAGLSLAKVWIASIVLVLGLLVALMFIQPDVFFYTFIASAEPEI